MAKRTIEEMFPGLPSVPWAIPKLIVAAVILLIVAVAAGTSAFTVPAESEGVVLRFGKFITTVPPGLHFKDPFGIESVAVVPVRRQLKQEFGFGTAEGGNQWQSSNRREWEDEKAMVTGDLNAALVEWVV